MEPINREKPRKRPTVAVVHERVAAIVRDQYKGSVDEAKWPSPRAQAYQSVLDEFKIKMKSRDKASKTKLVDAIGLIARRHIPEIADMLATDVLRQLNRAQTVISERDYLPFHHQVVAGSEYGSRHAYLVYKHTKSRVVGLNLPMKLVHNEILCSGFQIDWDFVDKFLSLPPKEQLTTIRLEGSGYFTLRKREDTGEAYLSAGDLICRIDTDRSKIFYHYSD